MKIPYNRVYTQGSILFAARGGSIHSFSLLDGTHVSTWQHPDVAKVADALKAISDERIAEESKPREQGGVGPEGSEPPAKRQKCEDEGGATAGDTQAPQHDAAQNSPESKDKGGKDVKKRKDASGSQKRQVARVPDRPVITQLIGTADERHVLAVSGHDKIIWVFDHDGQGELTLSSQRIMPKRPCAVAIAPDSQIICADKFGDVYSLPLLKAPVSPSPTTAMASAADAAAKPSAPAASTLTVHSRRNREALENQKKQLELERQRLAEKAAAKDEVPDFELTLLLGHVSMLTSLVLAESDGRKYIVTSDRDEHIRVSRYIPQAHIIEGFCLGHNEFVCEMIIPVSRPNVLVSGGGDEELFTWDWKTGKLFSKTSILSLAQEMAPGTSKVAVTGLTSLLYPTETCSLTYIIAICEGVKAIFTWQLTPNNTLDHPGIIQLPVNPLQVAVAASEGTAPPKLVIAMDPGQTPEAKSLQVFSLAMNEGRLSVDTEMPIHDRGLEANAMEASEKEIQDLLYVVENLRKHTGGGGEEEIEGDAAALAEAPATES